MSISFRLLERSDLPLYYSWAERPHVKSVWFLDGYERPEEIEAKIDGNGYDFPYLILLSDRPIGYIQASDLAAYRRKAPSPKPPFDNEPKGTYCFDLFIGEEDCLGKGYGTQIVRAFSDLLTDSGEVRRLVIDPALSNKRAIHCYEKAGFHPLREIDDETERVLVMERLPPIALVNYNPDWPKAFEHECNRVQSASPFPQIEHIGSTSIPNLPAKPVIDMLGGVHNLLDVDISGMEALGYTYMKKYESTFPKRRYFRQDAFHLHVVEIDSPFWKRHLRFRDHLRAHPEVTDEYRRLKQRLAWRYTDTNDYAAAKTDWICSIERSI